MGILVLNHGTGFRPTFVAPKGDKLGARASTYPNGEAPGSPFGYKGEPIAGTEYADSFATLPSTGLATVTGKFNPHPLANFHNTGTIAPLPPMINDRDPVTLAPLRPKMNNDLSQLHERNVLQVPKVNPQVKPVNSVDENSNTPFHPKKQKPIARSPVRSPKLGERTAAASFTSHAATMTGGGQMDHNRWSVVKRGAAG